VTVNFPSPKAEIEQYILDRVLETDRKTGRNFYNLANTPTMNPEQDFDFSLPTVTGLEYLDLMEIKTTQGPYGSAPASYWVWDFAEATYGQLLKKAATYGPNQYDAIHLLLYSTDWRYHPDVGVLELLKIWLAHGRNCFRTVRYYAPDSQTSGELFSVFPSLPEERRAIDVKELKERAIMPADFSRLRVEKDGSVSAPICPPPPGWKP